MTLLPSPIDKVVDRQQIEKEYLRIPRFALRLLGIWPHDKLLSLRVLPLTIFCFTILTLSVISEVGYSYQNVKNLPLALDSLCPALTLGVIVIKFVMLLKTRTEVAKMLDDLKIKWINDKSPECSYLNLRATRLAYIAAFILLSFSYAASIGYNLRPVGRMLQQHLKGEEIVRTLPFKSAYPYDAYTDTTTYVLTYLFLSISATVSLCGLAGLDGIFVALCLHITAQFNIVKYDFEQLDPVHKNALNEKIIQYSKSENETINAKLKKVICRHQETIQLNNEMVDLYMVTVFFHFVSAALVLCSVSVNFLLAKDAEAILYVCYGISALSEVFFYCACGTMLDTASYDISVAAYFINWYKMDIRNQRLALLVLRRAQIPCRVVVPFFECSLPTFTSIMSATLSYIALFRSLLD